MNRMSWTEHRTDEEVLKNVEEKRSLMDIKLEQSRRTGQDTFYEAILYGWRQWTKGWRGTEEDEGLDKR